MKKLLFFLPFLLCFACKNDTGKQLNTDTAPEQEVLPTKKEPTKLTVNIDNLRLRATAGEEGKEVARLPKGTIVYDLGEVSDFATKVKLRGIQFNEPWVKVKTENGVEGWIYAGGLHFDLDSASDLSERLLQIRLQNMFGKDIARRLKIYRTNYHTASTSEELAKAYRESLFLRDTMMTLLGIQVPEVDYERIADLHWLEQSLPGYKVQLVSEGTMYYMFNDYKLFEKKAHSTVGTEDDEMGDLLLSCFDVDSVEYFFPSWFLQTWDYGGASLLGQGIHIKLLQKMQNNYRNGMFRPEVDALRTQLIEDITNPHNTFWEPQDRILDELDKILDKGFQQLTKEDVIALETRRKLLEDPKTNGIQVNLRSGME